TYYLAGNIFNEASNVDLSIKFYNLYIKSIVDIDNTKNTSTVLMSANKKEEVIEKLVKLYDFKEEYDFVIREFPLLREKEIIERTEVYYFKAILKRNLINEIVDFLNSESFKMNTDKY